MCERLSCCTGTGVCRSCSSIAISRKQEKGKKQPTCASQRRLHWLGLHLPSLLASLVLGGRPCFSESAGSGSVLLCSEHVYLPVCSLKYLETCCGLGVGNPVLAKENGSQIQRVYQAHGDHSAVEVSLSCKLLLVGELPECAERFGKSHARYGHCHNRNNP